MVISYQQKTIVLTSVSKSFIDLGQYVECLSAIRNKRCFIPQEHRIESSEIEPRVSNLAESFNGATKYE